MQRAFRQRLILTAMALLCMVAVVSGEERRYAIGITGGRAMLTGGDFFSFKPATAFGGYFRYHPGGRLFLDLNYARFTHKNDESKDSTGFIQSIRNNAPLRFKSSRIGLSLGRYLFEVDRRLNLSLSLDGGLVIWRVNDPAADTTVKVRGPRNENTNLAATELSAGGTLGLITRLSSRWSLSVTARGEYLTGSGAEFETAVQASRDRWLVTAQAALSLHFGGTAARAQWPSDSAWRASSAEAKPRAKGAPQVNPALTTDSDHDGIVDAYDDCPGTPREANGMVDIHGCPVDADFDGVPDYRDRCPGTPTGAMVDSTGCPIDSDGDGVPDGLDDCPDSPIGVPVDRFGCIDLTMFSKPIVLHIDYLPGAFDFDVRTKDRLKKLAGLLLLVPDVKLDIVGYTDNIGLPEANQKLSEKRARRIRDYLVAMGVAGDRIKASGRGEENQIAPNDTAVNRAKNRRIEIMFYR